MPRTPPTVQSHIPADDAAAAPHESDPSIVEVPAKLSSSLPQQHEALGIGHNLAGIQGLWGRENVSGNE